MAERPLAAIAAETFINASLNCPSSVTGQGAYIARLCLEKGLDSLALWEALEGDPEQTKKFCMLLR